MSKSPVIIGAGPAGLSAAYEAVNRGLRPVVIEGSNMVGGIARTERYKDYYFDVGGHRFFSKIEKVNTLWRDMMGDDFLKVSRQSRIYYNGKFYNYPLRVFNALSNIGIVESILIIFSFAKSQIVSEQNEDTFEQWIVNRFGRRLYHTFFKTYTEKVWGISCSKIKADWAAQRIKTLSLKVAVYNAISGNSKATSLIEQFEYPRKGPGMMWENFQKAISAGGGEILFNSFVIRINHDKGRITGLTYAADNSNMDLQVENLISSVPVTQLVEMFEPRVPENVLDASDSLSYRAFVIVVLIIDEDDLFNDQWIYVHSPDVKVGRIQNFKNWSMEMVPDPGKTSVGMEYFCNEDDQIWSMPDDDLIVMAHEELSTLELTRTDKAIEGVVLRQPKAYPVYDQNFKNSIPVIRGYIDQFENLNTIGRNGLHRYNNMDHSMLTGFMAVDNMFGARHDLWAVNEEEEYHEEDESRIRERNFYYENVFKLTFARMDKLGFATAIGSVFGLLVFCATLWLMVRVTPQINTEFNFLFQYIIGYSISIPGALSAFCHLFLWGFLLGWLFAYIRNLVIVLYLFYIRKKSKFLSFHNFMKLYR